MIAVGLATVARGDDARLRADEEKKGDGEEEESAERGAGRHSPAREKGSERKEAQTGMRTMPPISKSPL